jgi:hypothetical protein
VRVIGRCHRLENRTQHLVSRALLCRDCDTSVKERDLCRPIAVRIPRLRGDYVEGVAKLF